MDFIDTIVGIAVGAAFSPFWMMIWNWLKDFVGSKISKQ
jgi:hypothetical protein